jgi:hypothetical protein
MYYFWEAHKFRNDKNMRRYLFLPKVDSTDTPSEILNTPDNK